MNINEAIDKIASNFQEDVPQEEVESYRIQMQELLSGGRPRWNLYRSLHNVGDDPVKASIQDDLRTVFDDDTYALIEAIFHQNACEDW